MGIVCLAALAAPAAAQIAGVYELHQLETASALEIGADGRFRWFLSQGALDLSAEGRWRQDGATLRLTSTTRPVPPAFALTGTAAGEPGSLLVKVVNTNGQPQTGIDVAVAFADGTREDSYTDQGERQFALEGRTPVAVLLGIDMFGVAPTRFATPAAAGATLTFSFAPNDLGREYFDDVPARVAPDAITLEWRGEALLYRRAEPSDDAAAEAEPDRGDQEDDDVEVPPGRAAREHADHHAHGGDRQHEPVAQTQERQQRR